MAASFPAVTPSWDKGLVLSLAAANILSTGYTYTPVVNLSNTVFGTLSPTGACVQLSGASRNLSILVNLVTDGASTITTITVDVEVAYGNFVDGTGTPQTVDLTQEGNWAKILSTVHLAGGTTNVDSACTGFVAGVAAPGRTVLVTCALPIGGKHLKIGAKADHAGVGADLLQLFALAW